MMRNKLRIFDLLGGMLLLLLFNCFLSFNASALLSSSITIGVQSSSNYLYPCNVGVAENSKSPERGIDYVRGTWIPSERNISGTVAGSGTAVGGATTNNNPDPDYALLNELIGEESFPYPQYNQLLPEATMYNYVIGGGQFATSSDKLQIYLSSDTYNASFYVTFCFKPSQFAPTTGVPDVLQELKFASGKVTHSPITSLPTGSSYAKDAALNTMMEIMCSDKDGTAQHYAPVSGATINTMLVPFETTVNLIPPSGIIINRPDYLIAGSNSEEGVLPQQCRVRFYFVETSGKLRPHTLTSSDIKIDLDAKVGVFGSL